MQSGHLSVDAFLDAFEPPLRQETAVRMEVNLHMPEPGDRAADCGRIREPVAVWVRKGGEWAVIHRCKVCGVLHSNRVAADDNPALLMSLAVKPLAEPPFPLSRLKDLL